MSSQSHDNTTSCTKDQQLPRHRSKSKCISTAAPCQLQSQSSMCRLAGSWAQNVLECNPDSTNWMVRLVLIVATAAFTSFGTTSPPGHERKSQDASHSWRSTALLQPQFAAAILWAPGRYIMQQAMYLPCRGSHLHDAWM